MNKIKITKGVSIYPALKDGMIKNCIRVYGDRIYRTTGHKISPDQWNDTTLNVKNHDQAIDINNNIENQVMKIKEILKKLEHEGKLTLQEIKKSIDPETAALDTYFVFANKYIDRLKIRAASKTDSLSSGTVKNHQKFLRLLFGTEAKKGFTNQSLRFSEIDTTWLKNFLDWLQGDRKFKQNTINAVFKIFKRHINEALEDKIISVDPFAGFKKDSPFRKGIKYKENDATYLTEEEVDRIEKVLALPLPHHLVVVTNYFLLGCYAGFRFSDWVTFSNKENVVKSINGVRLMKVCQKNDVKVSIPMHSRLRNVLDRLEELPPVFTNQKTNEYLKVVAKLAGIEKNLTCHVSRHTFCTMCASLGIPIEVCASLIGDTVQMCKRYYHILDSKVEQDMKKWDDREIEKQLMVAV